MRLFVLLSFLSLLFAAACQPVYSSAQDDQPSTVLPVLAVESFLADIAQNVAGERLTIETLIPVGMDPHTFEPTPQDVTRIAQSQVLIVNGAGFEEWLDEVLENAGGERLVIDASNGLNPREPGTGEDAPTEGTGESICVAPSAVQTQEPGDCELDHPETESEHGHEGDPHFWLDPNYVIRYVENIRDGLSQVDPNSEEIFNQNAEEYISELEQLDSWIVEQVDRIPPEERLLVTNHESFGYFADRYGFSIIGTVIPSVSSGSSPSAQQLASLIDAIRSSNVKAIFLETGANPEIAQQIAQEIGVKMVSGLYTHSLSPPGGEAPTYIDMMVFNTETIVESLR
jgi:ABC-type Zn uptake system ZnuABC Zn-binding protein ZnuA